MQRIIDSHFQNKKTALVLSGGVVKAAAWHLGVALALDEMGFELKSNQVSSGSAPEISTYVGSSAGALISLYFASGLKPSEILEAHFNSKESSFKPITYKKMLSLKKPQLRSSRSKVFDPFEEFPIFLKSVLKPFLKVNGLFTTEGLKQHLHEEIGEGLHFKDLAADLFVVATQLDHSRKVIFSKYKYPSPHHDSTASYYENIPVIDAVAGSMSVPPFYAPYPIENPYNNQVDYYIDGEIRETLSTHVAVDNNCDFIISSWTHTPYHFQDEIGSLVHYGLPAICTQAIYLLIQKKIVSSRARWSNSKDILDTVHQYMTREKFSSKQRNELTAILERKLNYKKNVTFIDIYPKHHNFDLFFKNSFSLNAKSMGEIVTWGYRETFDVFKEKEWLE